MVWGIGYLIASAIAVACGVQFTIKVGLKKISAGFSIGFLVIGFLYVSAGSVILTTPIDPDSSTMLFSVSDFVLRLAGSMVPYLLLLISRRYGRVEPHPAKRGVSILSRLTGLLTVVIVFFIIFGHISEHVIVESEYILVPKGFLGKVVSLILGVILVISLLNFESTWRIAAGKVKKQLLCLMIINLSLLAVIIRLFFLGQVSAGFFNYGTLPVLITLGWLYILLLQKDSYSSSVVIDRQAFFSSAIILFLGIFLVFTGIVAMVIDKAGGRTDIYLSVLGAFLVVGVFFLVLISDSLRNRLSGAFQSRIFAGQFDYKTEWRAISDDFAACDSIEHLVDGLTQRLRRLFGLSHLAVYIDSDGRMNCVYPVESELPGFSANDPAARWIYLESAPFKIAQLKVDSGSVLNEIASNYEIIVPVVAAQKLAGILLLGPKNPTGGYNSEDLSLLAALGQQAAVTLLHLRSRDRLLESEKLASFHKTASFVVHDLKNAVSMLSLMLQNAPRKMSDPMFQEESIRTISLAVDRMQKIIEKLKSPPKKNQLQILELDPMETMRQAIARSGIKNKRNIELIIDTDEKQTVKVDPGILETIFANLLINAVEAMPDGGTIRIGQEIVGDKLGISVADTGIGMDKSFMRNKLFRPFETTKAQGLGVGLYQCREMIRESGGDIIVQSEPGKGSKFTVTLRQ